MLTRGYLLRLAADGSLARVMYNEPLMWRPPAVNSFQAWFDRVTTARALQRPPLAVDSHDNLGAVWVVKRGTAVAAAAAELVRRCLTGRGDDHITPGVGVGSPERALGATVHTLGGGGSITLADVAPGAGRVEADVRR